MATASTVAEKQERVKEYLKQSVYTIRDKKGLAIIIDQRTEQVNSNERDIRKIVETFGPSPGLGFHIHELDDPDNNFRNLNASRLTSRFKNKVAAYDRERKYDCLFVFVLSFSTEKNHVCAGDGDYIIEQLFESIQEFFVGKPKVFFFRTPHPNNETRIAAPGDTLEIVDDDDEDEGAQRGRGTAVVIPQRADYLVVINAHPFKKVDGSETEWKSDFIDILTDYIKENSTRDKNSIKDLMSLLTRVQARLSELEPWDQQEGMMPFRLNYTTLTKKIILKRSD